MQELKNRAIELLENGTVARVLGWKIGENTYDPEPAFFDSVEAMKDFVYNNFCAANLSKYMIEAGKLEGKTLVCLKPCDSYSYNQLISDHRVDREKAYIIGVGCKGKLSIEQIKKSGAKGILSVTDTDPIKVETLYGNTELPYTAGMLSRCFSCKGKEHVVYDELIGESQDTSTADRFAQVKMIEAMSPEEKFAFFQAELSKCIRCNACRNACPACTCEKCIFDNPASGVDNKAVADSFEENMFHIIRAFHVAGRCTDCGECSRVCPQNIPLHLLNRKFIKDINEFYGEYQAGAEVGSRAPLVDYTTEDLEPGEVFDRRGE